MIQVVRFEGDELSPFGTVTLGALIDRLKHLQLRAGAQPGEVAGGKVGPEARRQGWMSGSSHARHGSGCRLGLGMKGMQVT